MSIEKDTINKAIISLAHHDFSKGLNLHAFYKINNKELSNDLVQETFMKTCLYLMKGGKIVLMRLSLSRIKQFDNRRIPKKEKCFPR